MNRVVAIWPEPVLLVARPCHHESVEEGEIGVSWHLGRRETYPSVRLQDGRTLSVGNAVAGLPVEGNLLCWAKRPIGRNSYPIGEGTTESLWSDLRDISLAPMPVHYVAEGVDHHMVSGWLGVPRRVLVELEVEDEEREPWQPVPEEPATEMVHGLKYFRLGAVVRFPADRKHPTDLRLEAVDILYHVMHGAAVDKLDRLLDLAEGRGGMP